MHYPIAIHKDAKSDYGVSVPDLPGCISAGETIEDALVMAREAIELHLIGLIEEGGFPPEPTPIEQWREDPDFAGATWAVVRIEESNLSPKAQRVQITLPERLLIAVDEFADRHDQTRSGLLARAVWEYMGRGDPGRDTGPVRRVRATPGQAGKKAKGKAPKRATPKGTTSTGKPRGKAPAKRTGPARRAK